ncbi:Pentatricopeptide repeat [Macleaya cordata]|uniref:Pentatricopeptide repeat n=1 Tax=Macleaya cordata TaxID=56857 RepID=A0A200PZF3_MACCD|nr:Pentatricopeptide repeat [Macleaya cordata]
MLACSTQSFPPLLLHQSSIHRHLHHLHPRQVLHSTTTINNTHNVQKFKTIHANTKPTLFLFNLYLRFYTNAGLMDEAQNLFDEMPERTLVSWTILMTGYTRHGPAIETLLIFQKLVQDHTTNNNQSMQPDSFVYGIVLRACANVGNLNYGREIHCRVLKNNGAMDSFVENALVKMYSSCGSLEDSARVFAGILRPDLVSWSSMLNGYVQNGLMEQGLGLFITMIRDGIKLDAFAFSMVIGASANLGYLNFGLQVHCCIIKMGFCSCLFLENSLMDFYAKCGDFDSLKQIFYRMPERDLVSWNTAIKGLVHNLQIYEALRLFRALMDGALYCDDFTLTSVLQAITSLGAWDHGREVHGYLIKAGFESNLYVISSLLDMYIECIDHESLDLREEIHPKIFNLLKGIDCDEFIIASILKWCSFQLDLETGKAIHSQIIKQDLHSDPYVISSLIDMYSKCGIPVAAQRIFLRIKKKSLVPWSAIIAGHCWNGWFEETLRFFRIMQFDGVEANEFIYTSVLLACLALGDFKKGRELHCKIIRTGFGSNISVMNTLINLYSELLHHKQALMLCSSIPDTEISWDYLIQACMRVEDHETMLKLLYRIQNSHGKIDSTSASYILSSCASPVLLNVGTQIHAYMTKRGLISDPATGNSLIKMYSGCGKIADAIAAFSYMLEKNSDSWTSLISANVDHGYSSEAIELFTQMRGKNKLPNSITFTSVLKAYAQMGLVDEAFRVLVSMEENYRIEPAIEHYFCIVEVLGRAGMFEEAREFINGVFPLEPVPLVWKTLLSASRIHGNMTVAKYIAGKLLELEPSDLAANLLLKQVLLAEGNWDGASKMKTNNKSMKASSSWIEIRNRIYEFVSDQIPTEAISTKLAEMERSMGELGYVADRNHLLHDLEEEDYAGAGLHHTEMKALAFGLLSLSPGVPVRIMKSVRMCGDCHSACKFMSTFLGRDLVVKDSCKYHNFSYGKCSCRDAW